MFVHLVIGNSILAIHRTIYLKRTNFVKIFIGEEVMMFISLVGGFLVSTIMIFYNHLYKPEKLMLNNSVISRDTYKNRKRTNIFSMGGQICCFITELLFMANGIIWINLGDNYSITSMKEIYFVFKIYEFGFLSTVQVLTSKELCSLFKNLIKIKND